MPISETLLYILQIVPCSCGQGRASIILKVTGGYLVFWLASGHVSLCASWLMEWWRRIMQFRYLNPFSPLHIHRSEWQWWRPFQNSLCLPSLRWNVAILAPMIIHPKGKHTQVLHSFDLPHSTFNTARKESIQKKMPLIVVFLYTKRKKSAGQAYLPSKQQSHNGEEYGQNEEYVGGAHRCVVGELIWLSPNLVDVEAHGEDESSHAEQDHCDKGETDTEGRLTSSDLEVLLQYPGSMRKECRSSSIHLRIQKLWFKFFLYICQASCNTWIPRVASAWTLVS